MRSYYQTEKRKTPPLLKRLILITALTSIFSSLFEIFIHEVFRIIGPGTLLSLNPTLVAKGLIYQPLSYLFVYGQIGEQITFGWLIGLLILLYFLWVVGGDLIERVGAKQFLLFYLGSGVFAGVAVCTASYIFGLSGTIAGPGASILAILVLWCMFNTESKLFVFYVFSIKVKWLVAITIGLFLLTTLNAYDILYFISYVSGVLFAWGYGLFVWQLKSPFKIFNPLEKALVKVFGRITSFFKRKESKIIDIRTGEEINDDDRFMDEMLEKITKKGKASLTFFERLRMQRISKKKNRSK